ncbi:MAG: hypothetical protein C0625_16025 [Arcobacter sp.]|nr:MAG: hypothetical protein C0625_16025 [Arcobacter sp.]
MSRLKLIVILFFVLIFSGCSIKDTNAKLVPNSELKSKNIFYVVLLESDKRNIAKMIADTLVEKGYSASSGTLENLPKDSDVVVTYEDRWMWDLTNYLIQFDMQFRNAKNFYPYVAGETIRTSVVRKSPKEMAEETITTMLNKLEKEKND